MKLKARIIIVTAVCTTLFWIAVAAGFIWFTSSGDSGRIRFTRAGEMEVLSGAYRVDVIASNSAAASLLFSHTARAPERVSFTVERLDTKTAQR